LGTSASALYGDVNLLGYNRNTVKKNTEALTDVSKEVGLEINAHKINYKLIMAIR
jgi:hypothetical protein